MASLSVCNQAAFPLRVNNFVCWVDLGGNWESHLGLDLIRGLSRGHLQALTRGGDQVSGWDGDGVLIVGQEGGLGADYSKERLACVVRCFEE